jgi:hypothetical protein
MTSYNTNLVEKGKKIFEIISQSIYNTQNPTIKDYINKIDYFIERKTIYYLINYIKNANQENKEKAIKIIQYFIKKYFVSGEIVSGEIVETNIYTEIYNKLIGLESNLELKYFFPISFLNDTTKDFDIFESEIQKYFLFRNNNVEKKTYDQGNVKIHHLNNNNILFSNQFMIFNKNDQKHISNMKTTDFSYNIFDVVYSIENFYGTDYIKCIDSNNNCILINNNSRKIIKELLKYFLCKNTIDEQILKSPKIEEVILIPEEINGIQNNIFKIIGDKNKFNEIIIILLLGAKRSGDWFQQLLAKKYSFYLKTIDKLCKVF